MNASLRILSVCTSDGGGGAERVARELHEYYREAGHRVSLAVGRVTVGGDATHVIPNDARRSAWARACIAVADALPPRHLGFHLARLMRGGVAEPVRAFRRALGEEDVDFPGTPEAFVVGGSVPDAVHLHNLHGGYFDLRVLADWSSRAPVVLSLHDAWLLSGHCSHSFGCDRWMTGCGECPALWIHPAVPRDATAYNWQRKRDVFARSSLHVAVPCEWLATRVRDSILAPAVRSLRVIPYGVDLSVYRPADDRAAVKRELGLDPKRLVFAVFANALRERTWKDARMFLSALGRLESAASAQWVALGERGPDVVIEGVLIRRVAPDRDDRAFARWFQAADAYVHPARADTFPLVILEAQACGASVIATAVDGIPEQVISASPADMLAGRVPPGATGSLTAAGNAPAMARALDAYASSSADTRTRMSESAVAHAQACFDRTRYRREYESWLRDLAAQPRPSPDRGRIP